MTLIEKVWYQQGLLVFILKWMLSPLMLLFWLLSKLRRMAFDKGLLKSVKVSVPVIIVGNISVGGNGKTPLVVFLANLLSENGYRPGILSRGYGGKASFFPASVDQFSDPAKVGDEPILLKQHVNCPVVVDPQRPRGASYLIDKHHCDIVLCDDGLQHYQLQRDIEIAVVDAQRRFGNGYLLPMGPLRERVERLSQVDFVIVNGKKGCDNWREMQLQPGHLVNLVDPNKRIKAQDINEEVCAVAAIGNPQRFFDLLKQQNVKIKSIHTFVDHHQFSQQDIPLGTVIMTEKDAVKCRQFASDNWWFLPVTAQLESAFTKEFVNAVNNLNNQKVSDHGV